MTRKADAGFTLIEVLVSLALFALIAGAGVSVLDQVLRAQNQTDARLDRLGALQRLMHLVHRDIAEGQPSTVSGDLGTITILRSSEDGPFAISYAVIGDQLTRQTLSDGGAPNSVTVLAEPAEMRWQYLDDRGQWHDTWQQQTAASQPALRAVEMTLALRTSDQALRRLIILPQALPRGPLP